MIDTTNHSESTKKGYKTTKEHVLSYEDCKNRRYKLNEVDLSFYDGFIQYFNENNAALNTVGKNVKNLKVFLSKAMDVEIISENRNLLKKMIIPEEETTKIYLTKDEIKTIYELDLSGNKKLERVRDMLVLACNIGLRFSDFILIKKENIKTVEGKKLLSVNTQKTNFNISVPLSSQALAILEKYDWNIPKPISNQKMNKYLKVIGKQAKIKEPVPTTITKGGKRVTTTKPKHELITTHTARRSFASNLFMSGVPSLQIMKLTGHKAERSFLKYIRVSAEENAIRMADLSFFK